MSDDFSGDPASPFDFAPEQLRRLGAEFLELALDILQDELRNPVLPAIGGAELELLLREPPPAKGTDPSQVLDQFRRSILAYRRRNGHPGFWAYVCSSADPVGVLADLLASAMNQIVTSWRSAPTATAIERQVIGWLDEMVGFCGGGHGLLLGGGSAANTTALACAVSAHLHRQGLAAWQRERLTLYASREIHVSVRKAVRLLGIPTDNLRLLAIDHQRRLQVSELENAVNDDLEAGQTPFLVCSSAGTANSGAIDPLKEISGICRHFGLWHHVDGSYGALAALAPAGANLRRAFAGVDSLALDPHKWLFTPIDCGCLLLRDAETSASAFSEHSEYASVVETAPLEDFAFFDHGIEMSRRFRALKIWLQLKIRGVDAYRAAIAHNIELRQQLDARIEREPLLERLASDLSICCFRFRPRPVQDPAVVDSANQAILAELSRRGSYKISPTTLDGRFCLRVCIVNFRTTSREIQGFVDQVLEIGREIFPSP